MTRNNAARNRDDEHVVSLDKKRRGREESEPGRFFTSDERREALGFVLIAVAVVLFTSLILNPAELRGIASSQLPSPAGKFGRWIATQIGIIFGFGGLVIPFVIGSWGISIFKRRPVKAIAAKCLALAVGLISACAFLGLIYDGGYLGGALGDRLAFDLYQTFGLISYVVVFFTGTVSLVIGTPLSFSELGTACFKGSVIVWNAALGLKDRYAQAAAGRQEALAEPLANQPAKNRPQSKVALIVAAEDDEQTGKVPAPEGREYFNNAETRIVSTAALKVLSGSTDARVHAAPAPTPSTKPRAAEKTKTIEPGLSGSMPGMSGSMAIEDEKKFTPDENFITPSITILSDAPPVIESVTEDDLKAKALGLQETLADFGVECKVGDIIPGPTVTRFEVVPAPGVKVSSITALADDIALAMAAPSIRIEAPIPGKAAVGIEIPNRKAHMVVLKEVIASNEFRRMREISPLAIALGQDISGNPIVADLRRMPHLLIAGQTGSGKSVCINSIVNSILLSSRPTEVKMIMVDPKVVELQEYNDIPHLLAPVVTDVRKAPRVLMWAVEEMERRYLFLARAGARDIESYNAIAAEAHPQTNAEPDDFVDLEDELVESTPALPTRMPYIVMIVDEFGDLMMVAAKECEEAIIRIAQKARAVGIHLIIATQRPSVDVITGIIKANLPSRIAFQVSSKVDSRTILDVMGAERLLGYGDMLFKPSDRPKPIRLQGNFISGGEIKSIMKHYRDQGQARRELIIDEVNFDDSGVRSLAGDDDPLLEQAMRICLEEGMASVSSVQRRLKVGHPRAGRIIDIMREKGLVTASDGSKPRKLLFDESYFNTKKDSEY